MDIDEEWQKFNISYDNTNRQEFLFRYLIEDTIVDDQPYPYILTHCCNSSLIKKFFPNRPIVFIKSDFAKSLKREWILAGHERFVKKQTKINCDQTRLEHYRAVKDPEWPEIDDISLIDSLPSDIQVEISKDYEKTFNINNNESVNALQALKQTCENKIDSCYETIKWHLEYYSKYPVDFSQGDLMIDIDNGIDNFSLLMKQELDFYSSEIFDMVWKTLHA